MAVHTVSTPITSMCTEISLSLLLEKIKPNQTKTENPEQKIEKAVILSFTKPEAHRSTPEAWTLAASMGVSYQ